MARVKQIKFNDDGTAIVIFDDGGSTYSVVTEMNVHEGAYHGRDVLQINLANMNDLKYRPKV